jgi:hypothetical protein
MRSLTTFSKGLLTCGLLAGSLLSGCSSDYALFKVTIVSTNAANRNSIQQCRMTIKDENNNYVIGGSDGAGNDDPNKGYLLKSVAGAPDPNTGAQTLSQGCLGELTRAQIGTFSYSSSRTTGTLTFRVDGVDSNGNSIQTGTSDPKTPAKFPPEVEVAVAIK